MTADQLLLRALVADALAGLNRRPAYASGTVGGRWFATTEAGATSSGGRHAHPRSAEGNQTRPQSPPAEDTSAGPAGHDSRMGALVELAQGGDAEAFGAIYDAYVDSIYRYLFFRLGDHALAEDLTSETFLRALRRLPAFTWQGRDIGAWLVTIARNLVADHYKSGRQRYEVVSDDISRHDSPDGGIEDDIMGALDSGVLLAGLRELKDEQRECLVLRFLQGLSVAQTALALGRSEGAVKQLQLRGVRALARAVEGRL